MSGGMVQLRRDDGTWTDCFPAGYKSQDAAWNVANRYGTEARVVDRRGIVQYSTEEDR